MKRENISYQNSEYNVQKNVLCINKPMTLEKGKYFLSKFGIQCIMSNLYCCGL